jgi:hypothetical protein
MPVETKEGEKKKEKFESYGQVPLDWEHIEFEMYYVHVFCPWYRDASLCTKYMVLRHTSIYIWQYIHTYKNANTYAWV